MEYTNDNCICIGEGLEFFHGRFRAYYCPIDGSYFWTFKDAEAGYEKIFGKSAEEVKAQMKKYCLERNASLAYTLGMGER